MPALDDVEMQYKATEPMTTAKSQEQTASGECTAEHHKKPVLAMRGGGIILDLCACFICCECMEGCCAAIDDCCCC